MYSVLILDDNRPMALQVFRMIPWEDIGCQVVGVLHDGISGKEAIEKMKPDLIVSDIEMPGLTGLQMMETVRSHIPNSQVIFISAYEKFNYAHQAIKLGACDYLVKPFTQADLRHSIGKAIAELNLAQQEMDQEQESRPVYSAQMEAIMDYLKDEACSNVTLEALADHFQMSQSKLGRMIKKETNMRYTELVAKLRIEKSKALLADPNLHVANIAEQVGYSDYLTFYKVFVRCEKISPTDYRKGLSGGKETWDED